MTQWSAARSARNNYPLLIGLPCIHNHRLTASSSRLSRQPNHSQTKETASIRYNNNPAWQSSPEMHLISLTVLLLALTIGLQSAPVSKQQIHTETTNETTTANEQRKQQASIELSNICQNKAAAQAPRSTDTKMIIAILVFVVLNFLILWGISVRVQARR